MEDNEFKDIFDGHVDFGNVEQMAMDCWLFLTHDGLPNQYTITREAFMHEVQAMIESCRQHYAKKRVEEVTATYDEYIKLLIDEINELIGMAHVHGWRSSRVEKGKELREKIAQLKESPQSDPSLPPPMP